MKNLEELKHTTKEYLKTGAKCVFGALIAINLASHNGFYDSMRTKEALRYQDPTNPVKVVSKVKEKWKDDKIYSLALEGYNPRVIRTVTFNDGSQIKLDYRVLAWKPFMKWKNGEEFDPKPGERYELTKQNGLVRKVGDKNSILFKEK